MRRIWVGGGVAVAAIALTVAPSGAHQTTTSRGATVTLHVDPDDEPIVGANTPVSIIRLKVPKGAKFSFSSCACRLKVVSGSGQVIADTTMKKLARVRFPAAAAYQLTYSGRYRKGKSTRKFAATFAVRAVAASE